MGRKGVSKRKKAKVKVKAAPVSGSISALLGTKTENQPEQVTEKVKASPEGKKKR